MRTFEELQRFVESLTEEQRKDLIVVEEGEDAITVEYGPSQVIFRATPLAFAWAYFNLLEVHMEENMSRLYDLLEQQEQ